MNAVDPEYVSNKEPPELVYIGKGLSNSIIQYSVRPRLTTVKIDAVVTELLQVSPLLLIAHLPFELVRVKPLPDAVAVNVAHVWVLQVP